MLKSFTISLAIASVLAAGSSAMAQTRVYRGDPMATSPRSAFNLGNPWDAYDASDGFVPFGGSHPWGAARGSASEPNCNPALDRAKGNLN